jgi:hypothetical protein
MHRQPMANMWERAKLDDGNKLDDDNEIDESDGQQSLLDSFHSTQCDEAPHQHMATNATSRPRRGWHGLPRW